MDDDQADPRPRYTVLGMFAGAGVGLLTGAFFFATLFPPPTDIFEIASRYTLFGLGPLLVGTLLVGLVTIRVFNRRNVPPFSAALMVFTISVGIVLLTATVFAVFGANFFIVLMAIGVPIIWCMTASGILLPWLSRHRRVSIASLAGLVAVCSAGLFNLS